jgi:hypothetical protein
VRAVTHACCCCVCVQSVVVLSFLFFNILFSCVIKETGLAVVAGDLKYSMHLLLFTFCERNGASYLKENCILLICAMYGD